jgi:AcrR family transcriptional regulator
VAKDTVTKDRILDAAYQLFTTSSYDRVSVDDVAARAGVSKGGLFHHFGSKYELGRECLFRGLSGMFDEGLDDNLGRARSPKGRLKGFIDVSLDSLLTNPKAIMFLIDVYEEGLKKGKDQKMWADFYNQYMSVTEELLKECGAKRPQLKARILMAAIDGLAFQVVIMDDKTRKEELPKIKRELLRMALDE